MLPPEIVANILEWFVSDEDSYYRAISISKEVTGHYLQRPRWHPIRLYTKARRKVPPRLIRAAVATNNSLIPLFCEKLTITGSNTIPINYNIKYLCISGCLIYSDISPEIANYISYTLRRFECAGCRLYGELPPMYNIEYLDARGNQFTGSLPSMPKARHIDVSGNPLVGGLVSYPAASYFDCSRTMLEDDISKLADYMPRIISFNCSETRMYGRVPVMDNLEFLDCRRSCVSGDIRSLPLLRILLIAGSGISYISPCLPNLLYIDEDGQKNNKQCDLRLNMIVEDISANCGTDTNGV